MIPGSFKKSQAAAKQQEMLDWLRAGGRLTPLIEAESSYDLENLKEGVQTADTAASESWTSDDRAALLLAAAIYRDALHATAGRQEVKGAAMRRAYRQITVAHGDIVVLRGGRSYA